LRANRHKQAKSSIPADFSKHLKKTPLHPRNLDKKDRIIPHHFTANPLHLTLTATAKEIKSNAILLRLDQLAEPRSQLGILRFRQIALKHTVLHPLSIRFENFVDFSPTLIIRNVIRNNHKHNSLLQN
jgi:hypothetical protein